MTTTAGPPVQAGTQTRVTLVGRRRRVDVVVPSGEPVGRLLPEALRDDNLWGLTRRVDGILEA